MMKCLNCGTELPESAKFCFACGSKQEVTAEVPQESQKSSETGSASDETVVLENMPEESSETGSVSDVTVVLENMPQEPSQAGSVSDETVVLEDFPEEILEDEPVYDETAYDKPVYGEPAYDEPVYDKPVYDEPTYDEPVYDEPVYDQPVYGEAETEMPPVFCPYCGVKNDGDAMFCCACGRDLKRIRPEDTVQKQNDGVSPKKRKSKKNDVSKSKGAGVPNEARKRGIGKIVGVVAAVVVVAAAVFAAVKLIGGSSGGPESYLNYVKDGRLTSINMDSRKKQPVVYKGSMTDYYSSQLVTYSEDGKYMYFLSDYSGSDSRLYAVKTGSDPEDAVKIDSSISQYWVMKSGKEVVYLKEDVLYKNDLDGNKEKIASNVSNAFIDSDQKYVIWNEYRDNSYAYYYRALDLKSDKVKLLENGYIIHYSDDFQRLYVSVDEILYVINGFGEKEKIDSEAVFIGVDEKGSMYYSKASGETVSAKDLVNDDMAEVDAAMTEPKIEDFVNIVLENGPDGLEKVESTDYDAYDAAWDAYYEKGARDDIRKSLNEYTIDTEMRNIYIYKDGKSEMIAENATYEAVMNKNLLVYKKIDMEELPKLNLSEIGSIGEVENAYREKVANSAVLWAYCGDAHYSFGENLSAYTVHEDTDNHTGYILTYGEDMRLFSFDTAGESALTEIAENVASVEGIFNGSIYYISDVVDGRGDLYCDGELVDSDVSPYTVAPVDGTELVCYAADASDSDIRFTLKTYDGKEIKKIADDVSMYKFIDSDTAALLVDFSTKRQEGDLKLYTGDKEIKQVDEGVSYIIGGRTAYHD